MISTRGRYALRVLIDLAEHKNGDYIPMKEVADRQDISLKYLERIMPLLKKANIVDGQHGKGGGYKLKGEPSEYRIGDILRLTSPQLRVLPAAQNLAKGRQDAERSRCGKSSMT